MNRLLFILVLSLLGPITHAAVVEKIVAIVNDEVLLLTDIDEFQKKLKNNGLVDDALLDFYDRKKMITDRSAAIAYLTDELMIDSEVKRQGIQAPIERVEGEIRNILNARGVTRDQMRKTLTARGVQFSDYQDFIKTSIQRQSLIEREVSSRIKISDDDIATYYIQKNLSSKPLVFEFTLSHIVFLNSNGGDEKARARAQSVKDRINNGSNFEAMASQYSEDPEFSQGGTFGTFRMGDLVPAIERSVQKLGPGEVSDLVKMGDGYHIFKVVKRSLVPSADFERRKQEISAILFKDAFQRQFKSWLANMKRASYVRINQ
jgi:parvulin-like peptidyl-prolyl isomerase